MTDDDFEQSRNWVKNWKETWIDSADPDDIITIVDCHI